MTPLHFRVFAASHSCLVILKRILVHANDYGYHDVHFLAAILPVIMAVGPPAGL